MKLLADNQIPLLDYFFADSCDILSLPFEEINSKSLENVDILLTRSQFKLNKELLQGSRLKFIGSCVTGTDHLDVDYLNKQQIPWYAAEGCNTQSVVEYTLSVLAALMQDGLLADKALRVGVVGVGRIGKRLRDIFSKLGYEVLLYDPFFLDSHLEDFRDLDLVTLHTPLTQSGPFPTYHMINNRFIKRQKTGCVFINSSRGGVINSADLLSYGKQLTSCLDVWEHEPDIDLKLLGQAYIGTPHIAGHSVQAKWRGTEYVYQAAAKLFNWPHKSMPVNRKTIDFSPATWQELVLGLMDPRKESLKMKQALLNQASSSKEVFPYLRKNYQERYELEFIDNIPAHIPKIWS